MVKRYDRRRKAWAPSDEAAKPTTMVDDERQRYLVQIENDRRRIADLEATVKSMRDNGLTLAIALERSESTLRHVLASMQATLTLATGKQANDAARAGWKP